METSSNAIISIIAEETKLASLNDRFLKYSEKVKALVIRNKQLDSRLKQVGCAFVWKTL